LVGRESADPGAVDSAGTVVFFHAHPDDEAIFTGGTIALLAAAGWRVVLVFATRGERGLLPANFDASAALGPLRAAETARAADILGVQRVEFLGYSDSGLGEDDAAAEAFAGVDLFAAAAAPEAAERLAGVLLAERPRALVTYDEHGIYGHPDHVMAHTVAYRAAEAAAVPTVYESTVDREYLHFVETHLVVHARSAVSPPDPLGELRLAATSLGQPTVLIDNTVDVRTVLDTKRAAMAAHASQIPESGYAMRLAPAAFSAVYGFEWYLRRGPTGPIEKLA
jgi:LmbE family N-acetylglucosaminyl deacetylase